MSRGLQRRALRRLRFATEEEMPEVREVVTFSGRSDLRRASRLTSVMRCGAAILENSIGSANTFDLSEEVLTIDTFLSHNWGVLRLDKFLCLVLHFNLKMAVVVMVASGAVVAGAAGFGFTLLWGARSPIMLIDDEAGDLQHGWGCTLLMPLVFLAVACFGHEVKRLVGRRDRMVFLDKTCIDQVNTERQREGILKLGAFLRSSSTMLVVYTDVYLLRLWTVYELACFLSLHPTSHLVVVPTEQPKVVLGFIAMYYGLTLAQIFVWGNGIVVTITLLAIVMILAAGIMLLRRWAREMEAIHQRLVNFEVGQCMCCCEEDRPVVYHNIALLMRACGWVGRAATEADALVAFNDIVRTRLSRSLATSIGPIGMNYQHAVLMCFMMVVPRQVDIFLLGVASSDEEWITRFRICKAVEIAIQVLGTFPLTLALMAGLCRLCLHLKGWQDWVFLYVSFALVSTFAIVVLTNLKELTVAAARNDNRDTWAVVQAAVLISTTVLAIGVFSRSRQVREEEEEGEEEQIEAVTLDGGDRRRV